MNSTNQIEKETSSDLRESLLNYLKINGSAVINVLAEKYQVTIEAVRQQLSGMERDGIVERETLRPDSPRAGRPQLSYRLTHAGEAVFPKNYPGLSMALMDAIQADFGGKGLIRVLSKILKSQVQSWRPKLAGKSLEQKLVLLKDMYQEGDTFTSVESEGSDFLLVEKNCPYYQVAMQRPQLCSLTVNTLSHLLGCEVVREQKFQEGHGKCVFRVSPRKQVPEEAEFMLESAEDQK